MTNKKCAICGQMFKSKADNAKYCGPICRDAGHQANKKKWAENNREYDRERMRKYRAEKAAEREAAREEFNAQVQQQKLKDIEDLTGGKFNDSPDLGE